MIRCMKNSQMGLLIKVLLIRKAHMRFIIMPREEGGEEVGEGGGGGLSVA